MKNNNDIKIPYVEPERCNPILEGKLDKNRITNKKESILNKFIFWLLEKIK